MKHSKVYKLGQWTILPDELSIVDNAASKTNTELTSDTIKIEPKCMELLLMLIDANGEIVSRDDIMANVWQGRYVSDHAINNTVSALRKYLGEHEGQGFIKTVPKRGYKLVVSAYPEAFLEVHSERQTSSQLSNANTIPISEPKDTSSTTQDTSHRIIETSPSSTITKHRKFSPKLAVAFCLFCILVLFVSLYEQFPQFTNEYSEQSELVTGDKNATNNNIQSLAVLPLKALSDEQNIDYFAEGLVEDLIYRLSAINDLRVISKYSSSSFDESEQSLAKFGQRLGVDKVIYGTIRYQAGLYKIVLHCLDIEKNETLWSQSFSASDNNLLFVQQDIAEQIALSFLGPSSVSFKNALTQSNEAYLHFLRGRKYNQQRRPQDLVQARDQFKMAVLLDPNFAAAHADLAVSYLLMASNKMLPQQEAFDLASKSIAAAISADSKLSEAYSAKGVLAHMQGLLDEAENAFKQALLLDENAYLALLNYANLLEYKGQPAQALELYQKVISIAPLSATAHTNSSYSLMALGRFDEAVNGYAQCVKRLPDNINCLSNYAFVLRLVNKNEQAEQIFRQVEQLDSSNSYYRQTARAFQLLWSGKIEQADLIFENVISEYGIDNDAIVNTTLVKLAMGKQKQWQERLKPTFSKQAFSNTFIFGYLVAAYFNQECDVVIPYLERILDRNPNIFYTADYIAGGNVYFGMLADCYKKTEQNEQLNDLLPRFKQMLEGLPDNTQEVPGFIYANAQYNYLAGDRQSYTEKRNKLIRMGWHLTWLFDSHPIFLTP